MRNAAGADPGSDPARASFSPTAALPSLEAYQRACPMAWGAAEGAGRALEVRGATWICAAAQPRAKAQRAL
eukprot:3756812-Pyramimonas_sp.AAC.1